MAVVAVHIVFFWVLGLTMNAKVVDQIKDKSQIQEIQNVEKEKTSKT